MSKKVFIVEVSGGTYDSNWNSVAGVYDSKELAEKEKNRIIEFRLKIASSQSPVGLPYKLLKKNEKLYHSLSMEDKRKHWEWRSDVIHAKEPVSFDILEFEINSPSKNYS